MSELSQLKQQVANLTLRLNNITTSARKIFQLPWQSTLITGSKLQVSNPDEISEFITVQQIIDAALSYRQNQLIEANVSVDENDVTVDAGAQWIINNVDYELASDFTETVPYAATGYTRNDILVGDQSNLIYRVAGPETEGISPTPNVPLNTVLVTVINVTDATIGYVPPVIGPYDSDEILNVSGVVGETVSDGLDTLNAADSAIKDIFPLGTKGQIVKVAEDNVKEYYTADIVSLGKYISTDEELEDAKASFETQEEIFETFKRYSHGDASVSPTVGVLSNLIPGTPLHTNSWEYDTLTNRILSNFNTGDVIGLISNDKVNDYIQKATIGSDVDDNDFIGLCLLFQDVNDLVPNNAFGLNPADFSWDIDVTSEFVPNQHTLTFFRNRNTVNTFFIAYNYMKLDSDVISNGTSSGVWNTTDNWEDAEVDVYVSKIGDIVTFKTSNFSDAPGGKGGLDFTLTIDLDSDPRLHKFKGFNSYGYCAQSQAGSFFYNNYITSSANDIFDVRNGDVWSLDDDNVYNIDATRNLYSEQIKSIGFNESTSKLFYFYDNSYVILSDFKKTVLLSVTVDTYADMLVLPANLNTVTVRVLIDEDKGIPNTEYKIYPDGKRIWIATTEEN